MKVAMIGSRTWPEDKQWMIEQVIDDLPLDTTVVSGGARGPDYWAEMYAAYRKMPILIFPAEWDLYGKSAGYRRNQDIVNAADFVVAFWDGESKGTLSSILLAKRARKVVVEVRPDDGIADVLYRLEQIIRPLLEGRIYLG